MRTMAGSLADIDVLGGVVAALLGAENKSAATITSYTYATTQLSAFLRERGMPTDAHKFTMRSFTR